MRGLFTRTTAVPAPDSSALGSAALALRVPHGATVPAACTGVAFDKGGRTRRIGAGERIALHESEAAFCFHPGPYSIDLLPFAAAPELGLQLAFAVDAPDPRVQQQRFDLYLASEAGQVVPVEAIGAGIEAALQHDLALGNLELPPCTTIDEWNAFRAGLNQLVYTRFGLTVEDCVPVDLGERVDYAQLLLARAARAEPAPDPAADAAPVPFDAAQADAQAMRRLFLELPGVTSALRLAALPPGQQLFRKHQELLQRLGRAILTVDTMPALALSAPGVALDQQLQAARAHSAIAATGALDEAWALVARLSTARQMSDIVDEADRIVANLEHHIEGRRA